MAFSVQLYTVPSVAYHLIEEHSVLTKLFSTFMSGYEQGDFHGALTMTNGTLTAAAPRTTCSPA